MIFNGGKNDPITTVIVYLVCHASYGLSSKENVAWSHVCMSKSANLCIEMNIGNIIYLILGNVLRISLEIYQNIII